MRTARILLKKMWTTKKRKMKRTGMLLWVLPLLLSAGCIKEKNYEKIEQDAISNYLKNNNISVAPTASGLYYVELKAGSGARPEDGDTVYINYIAYKLTGLVLDTNLEDVARQYGLPTEGRSFKPFGFVKGSGEVIAGLDEGVGYMREGGQATLVMPGKLAYGNYDPLAFYVELVKVVSDTTVVPDTTSAR